MCGTCACLRSPSAVVARWRIGVVWATSVISISVNVQCQPIEGQLKLRMKTSSPSTDSISKDASFRFTLTPEFLLIDINEEPLIYFWDEFEVGTLIRVI